MGSPIDSFANTSQLTTFGGGAFHALRCHHNRERGVGCELSGCGFRGVGFWGVNLWGVTCWDVNFWGVHFWGVNFGVIFWGVDFFGGVFLGVIVVSSMCCVAQAQSSRCVLKDAEGNMMAVIVDSRRWRGKKQQVAMPDGQGGLHLLLQSSTQRTYRTMHRETPKTTHTICRTICRFFPHS